VLNQYRVRTNFIPEDYGEALPALVAELAGRIQEPIDEFLDHEIADIRLYGELKRACREDE
jgi:hypothetical protein